jgi:hypothetical protein
VGNTVFGVRGSTAGGSTLANGQVFTTTTSGSTWTPVAADLFFTTFVTPPLAYFATGDFVSGLKDSNAAAGLTPLWGTLAWNAATPAGTAIQFQAAASNNPNGPFNFVGPDGTSGTFFTNGGSLSQFNGFRYLKYKAFFSTTDTTITPTLNDVTLCVDNKIVTTLTAAPASGVFGGTVNLSATLTDGSTGISGQTVSFTLNGNSAGSAVTDASGVASLTNVSLTGINAGTYPTGVGATFAGTSTYVASSSAAVLTVYALPTIAKAFGPTSILTGGTSTVTLTLTNPAAVGALINASFTDTLTNMSAVGGAAGGTCTGASSNTISAGATSLSFTGITIPDNGNCTVTFDVTSSTAGSHPNQTSGVTTTQTPAAGTASNSVSLTVLGAAVWTGASDTNWNLAANWNPTVPSASNGAVIPSGMIPNEPSILSAGTDVTVASLDVQSGRTLTIESGRTLTVTGTLTNNGAINNGGSFGFGTFTGNGGVSFTGTTQQTIPAGTFSSVTINNAAGVVLGGNVQVDGVLTLTNGNITTNANTLTIGPSGSISRTSGYVIGNLRKTFGLPPLTKGQGLEAAPSAVFVYPVGTANGFSPVTINTLTGSGSFTVSATQSFLAGTDTNQSIQRYWSLTPSGITSADITLQYLDADVPIGATEGNFKFLRKSGSSYASAAPSSFNTATNTFTINGVTAFSDWSLGNLVVTAASVPVSGQVRDTNGQGIAKASVTMTSSSGITHRTVTNPFGYYSFTDIPAGAAYTMNVEHKLYTFSPRVLSVSDAVDNLDFVALP